jgi:GTP-binding protein EngB required for normal cell division
MRLIVFLVLGSVISEKNCRHKAKEAEKARVDEKIGALKTKSECSRQIWHKQLMENRNMTRASQKNMFMVLKENTKTVKLDMELCRRFQEKYAPFGLLERKPEVLKCDTINIKTSYCSDDQDYDPNCEQGSVTQEPNQPIDKIDGKRVPNIVILGQTGAGKSYFANGLLGYQDPDSGPFGTANSAQSCTRSPRGVHADFYNNFLEQYGIERMKMNLFDTPGFGDSDTCQIEANKRRIANQFSKEIDGFIFLINHKNPRFNQNLQKIYKMLNEWTMGTIWQNIIFVYPRVTFTDFDRNGRLKDGDTWFSIMKQKRKELIKELVAVSERENWKIRNITDGSVRELVLSDFENIRTNALNVNQNDECRLSMGGISQTKHCWKLAKLDEFGQYDVEQNDEDCWSIDDQDEQLRCLQSQIDSESTESTEIKKHANQFVFADEARKLHSIIKEFMTHPVIPQKLYWEQQLDRDLAAFNERWIGFDKLQETILANVTYQEVNTTKCDKDYDETVQKIDAKTITECPYWGNWIYGECNQKCGFGSRNVTRDCLIKMRQLDQNGSPEHRRSEECIAEYPEDPKSMFSESCPNLPECKWSNSNEENPDGWVKFGTCSEQCGGGLQIFHRECDGPICNGPTSKFEKCNTDPCLTEWSSWGSCLDIGKGPYQRTRTRKCLNTKNHCYGAKLVDHTDCSDWGTG